VGKICYSGGGGDNLTSEQLKELMAAHGLNVKKTASMLHVSIGCMYKWMTGQRKIPTMASAYLQERLTQPGGKVLRLGDNWSVR
jgi:DNA-binding transcriptional regulator YiaG